MNLLNPFFPRHAFSFKSKGGGGGTTTVVQQPTPPGKPPAAVPPVTERTVEVEAAARQTKVDAKKRKGLRSTLLAGETGGYVAPGATTEGEKKTLLG